MNEYFPYRTLSNEDAKIAEEQVKTGLMSGFVGAAGEDFYGGEYVKLFEKECASLFSYKHAISVNSWTSGLLLMLLSLEKDEGEVVVTSWTMSATVTAIVQAGLTPIFVDIDPQTFMPSPESIRNAVTDKTVAILMADIFGQCFPFEELSDLRSKKIALLSDGAQAHLATRFGNNVGYGADISGISFNRHKHVNTGEGGVIFTNNERFAEFCYRARNHGENNNPEELKLKNLFGYNFRLTETQAAIGVNQLKKMRLEVNDRRNIAKIIYDWLSKSKKFYSPAPLIGNEHSYYIFPILAKEHCARSTRRKLLINKLKEENLPLISDGYVNVHKLPIFNNIEYVTEKYSHLVTKPALPTAEYFHEDSFFGIMLCNSRFTSDNIIEYLDVIEAYY